MTLRLEPKGKWKYAMTGNPVYARVLCARVYPSGRMCGQQVALYHHGHASAESRPNFTLVNVELQGDTYVHKPSTITRVRQTGKLIEARGGKRFTRHFIDHPKNTAYVTVFLDGLPLPKVKCPLCNLVSPLWNPEIT